MDFLAHYIITFVPPVHQMPVDFKAADVPRTVDWVGGFSSLFTEMTVEAFGEVFSPYPELCSFMLYYINFLTYLVVDSSTFPWNLYPGYWMISYSLIIGDKFIMWLTTGHIDVGISPCRSSSFHPWTVGCVCHLSLFVVLDEYHLPTTPWTLVPWVKETFP